MTCCIRQGEYLRLHISCRKCKNSHKNKIIGIEIESFRVNIHTQQYQQVWLTYQLSIFVKVIIKPLYYFLFSMILSNNILLLKVFISPFIPLTTCLHGLEFSAWLKLRCSQHLIWDTHEIQLDHSDDVSGDLWMWDDTEVFKPKFYQTTQNLITFVMFLLNKNFHARLGIKVETSQPCGSVCRMCSRTFTLFWLRKTSVIVEIFQWSFHVFVPAFYPEIFSFFGKSFPLSFPIFCVIHT